MKLKEVIERLKDGSLTLDQAPIEFRSNQEVVPEALSRKKINTLVEVLSISLPTIFGRNQSLFVEPLTKIT